MTTNLIENGKLEIVLTNKTELEQIVKSAITLVDEIEFNVDSESISIRTMDRSHVALIDVLLNKESTERYNVESEHKINLLATDLLKILAQFDPKERIKLEVDQGLFKISDYEGFSASTRILTDGYSGSNTPLPKLSFNTKFVLEDKQLKTLIKRSSLSEYFTIESNNSKGVTFIGRNDSGEFKQTFSLVGLDSSDDSLTTYSADYIVKFLKSLTVIKPENVTFEYSSKMPLRITVNLNQVINRIHFYLAPRITE